MSQLGNVGGATGIALGNPYAGVGGLPNPYQGYGTPSYPANAGSALNSYYNQQLGFQGANYGNIMAGYGALQNQIPANYYGLGQDVLAGGANVNQAYQGLSGQVLAGIQGVQQSQLNANQQAYAQQTGQSLQGLAAAGLGNTTVGSSIQSGLLQQKQLADTAVQNQFAQLQAGYQSQLGSAGIAAQQQANQLAAGYQSQGIGAQLGLGQNQLAYMQGLQLPQWNPNALGGMVQSSQDLWMSQMYGQQAQNQPLQHAPSAPSEGSFGAPGTATGAGSYLPGQVGGFSAFTGQDLSQLPGFYGQQYNQPDQGQGSGGGDFGSEWAYGGSGGGF